MFKHMSSFVVYNNIHSNQITIFNLLEKTTINDTVMTKHFALTIGEDIVCEIHYL